MGVAEDLVGQAPPYNFVAESRRARVPAWLSVAFFLIDRAGENADVSTREVTGPCPVSDRPHGRSGDHGR